MNKSRNVLFAALALMLTLVMINEAGASRRMYEIPTGGVIINDNAKCHAQPSSASRITATVRRDTVLFITDGRVCVRMGRPVFVNGEARDELGDLWYNVWCLQFEGWISDNDIRVYKYWGSP